MFLSAMHEVNPMNIDARAPTPVYSVRLLLRDIVDSKCSSGWMLWRFAVRQSFRGQAIFYRRPWRAFRSIRSPDLSADLSLTKHCLVRKQADFQR
jgi:hypothetical protein